MSKDLRFDELRKVLESYGYMMNAPKGGSSHYTFRKVGCQPITIPKHEPIKKVYVEMVKQIVESEAVSWFPFQIFFPEMMRFIQNSLS